MRKLKIALYILAGVCLVITAIDGFQHHFVNPMYACVTAADLCIASALAQQEKAMDAQKVK